MGVYLDSAFGHIARSAECRGQVLTIEGSSARCARCGWQPDAGELGLRALELFAGGVAAAVMEWDRIGELPLALQPTMHDLVRRGWWAAPVLIRCPEHGAIPHSASVEVIRVLQANGTTTYSELATLMRAAAAHAAAEPCPLCSRMAPPLASYNRDWLELAATDAAIRGVIS